MPEQLGAAASRMLAAAGVCGAVLLAPPLAAAPEAPAAAPTEPGVVAAFAVQQPGETPAAPWRMQTFPKVQRHTQFTLVDDGGTTVLRVHADAAAASLIRPLAADTTATPWLSWRWKPLSAPAKSGLGAKDADDWGARIYVLFEPPPETVGFGERLALSIARALYGNDLPARGLCYVWLPGGKAGAIAPNAYTDRLRMIVVDAGAPGDWRSIERNLADDYRAAFGEPAPPVSAIAVAADSDNGGGIAEVLVGDIHLRAQR